MGGQVDHKVQAPVQLWLAKPRCCTPQGQGSFLSIRFKPLPIPALRSQNVSSGSHHFRLRVIGLSLCLLLTLHSHSRHHDLPSPNPESTNQCSIGGSNVGHHNRSSQVCPCIRFLSVSHRRFKLQTRYLITYSNSTHRKNHHDTISFLLIGKWTLFHGTEPRSNQRTLVFAIVFYCITMTASFFLSSLFERNIFN